MRKSILLLMLFYWLPLALLAQPQFITSLNPPQHGLNIPGDAELSVGLQASLDPVSLSDSSIYVWSDITGLHKLTVTLENGNKDLRIVPRHWRLTDRPPFNAGERVTVMLTTRLRYADGRPFEGFTWHYTVAVRQFRGGDFSPLALFAGGLSTYFNVSDFNGDGWPDLIGNDDGVRRKMIVFLNDGKGVLQFSHIENIINPNAEVADLDRDGDQDIAYAGDYLIFNDGQANFTVKHFPERPNGFAKAHDFNNDGIMDFAIGSAINDTMHFGLSENETAFAKEYFNLTPIRPEFYYTGISYDLNNDGRVDLIYGGVRHPSPFGFVSFQNIDINEAQISQFLETKFVIINFYGNDFDGDSFIDYAMVGGGSGRNIQYMNDRTGMLLYKGLQVDSTNRARLRETVEGGDFDGDGDIDLAFASSNIVSAMPERYAPDVSIFLNDGKGNFSLIRRVRLPFDFPFLSYVLRAVDLDRDGDLDLIGIANGIFYVVANGVYPDEVTQRPSSPLPLQFSLDPVYPNPVKDWARIELKLTKKSIEEVSITIFDTTGRLMRSWFFEGRQQSIQLTWDIRDQSSNLVPSGIYFVQARLGKLSAVQKLLVLK